MWDLAPASLAFGEEGGSSNIGIPPRLLVEVVPEPVPSTGRPWETWEGELALGCVLQKSDIEPVGQVFCLTDQQPVQVDGWLRPMHPPP